MADLRTNPKVCLIDPYIKLDIPQTNINEPLGLVYLANYVEKMSNGTIDIQILDLYALGKGKYEKKDNRYIFGLHSPEIIIGYLNEIKPDVVGISCNFTAYAEDSYEIAATVKKYSSNVFVVLGGAHATMEAEEILRNYVDVDAIVRGEGEITFFELIKSINGNLNSELKRVKGLSFRKNNGEIVSNPDRELIQDLDLLPFTDRKHINMDFYKENSKQSWPFARKVPVATIMTSRGCPFNCVFCSTKVMWRRKWRPFSSRRVLEEIEYLYKTYGIKEIAIQDDQFLLDKKRVIEICDALINKNLNLSFFNSGGSSIWLIDEKQLKTMKKAGFYRLGLPIETGSPKTMKFIDKPVDLNKVNASIKVANKLGYWTFGNFIIGFPYETKEEIEQTIKFAYNSALDFSFFFIAKPLAGSKMYEIFKKEGLMKKVIYASHFGRSDYNTTTLSSDDICVLYNKAVNGFYVHKALSYMKPENFKNNLLPKLRSAEDIKYALKLLFSLLKTRIIPAKIK